MMASGYVALGKVINVFEPPSFCNVWNRNDSTYLLWDGKRDVNEILIYWPEKNGCATILSERGVIAWQEPWQIVYIRAHGEAGTSTPTFQAGKQKHREAK